MLTILMFFFLLKLWKQYYYCRLANLWLCKLKLELCNSWASIIIITRLSESVKLVICWRKKYCLILYLKKILGLVATGHLIDVRNEKWRLVKRDSQEGPSLAKAVYIIRNFCGQESNCIFFSRCFFSKKKKSNAIRDCCRLLWNY